MNWRDGFTARRVYVFRMTPCLRSQPETLSLASAKACSPESFRARCVCRGHKCSCINKTKCAKTTEAHRHREKAVFLPSPCLCGTHGKSRFLFAPAYCRRPAGPKPPVPESDLSPRWKAIDRNAMGRPTQLGLNEISCLTPNLTKCRVRAKIAVRGYRQCVSGQKFGGVSCETQAILGLWRQEGEPYGDSLALFVDVEDTPQNREFFVLFKERLKSAFSKRTSG